MYKLAIKNVPHLFAKEIHKQTG